MDLIEGTVLRVLDGDTFDLDVDRLGVDNDHDYNDVERVRLRGIDAPEVDSPAGNAALARLRAQLEGERVQVAVHARDRYGRIIGQLTAAA